MEETYVKPDKNTLLVRYYTPTDDGDYNTQWADKTQSILNELKNTNLEEERQQIIIEYLDELYPTPELLPSHPKEKAQVRSMALHISCDIHPLNNLRVLNQLKQQFQASEQDTIKWYHHWLAEGFNSLEKMLSDSAGTFCYGNKITIADLCLIPQVFNANRYKFNLSNYPLINKINDHCLTIPAFAKTAP
jgi:maleylacetoacetate isomerase